MKHHNQRNRARKTLKSQSTLSRRLGAIAWLSCSGLLVMTGHSVAEPTHAPKAAKRAEVSVVAGLIQPLVLGGGNLEVDVAIGRLVVGYSHGFLLNMNGSAVVGDAKDQGLAFKLPFSTGLSVGYRFTDWLDVRGELKWHRFDVSYDEPIAAADDELFSYDTVTVGVGIYGHWRPFRKRGDWMRGLTMATSVRLWPNVYSSLDSDKRVYDNAVTGQSETHEAANIGIANTPLVVNVSVGYAFQL